MPNYFKNLEETIESQEDTPLSPWKSFRRWINLHLRLVWNLVMMLILLSICLWASLAVSQQHDNGSIIEKIVPEVRNAQDIDGQLEKAAKSLK